MGSNSKKVSKGFTLIEILVVIGIIAILAAIVIVAINPAKQFAQARNTQRQAGVNTILNAIGQRLSDNKGIFEGTYQIGGTGPTYSCPVIPNVSTNIDLTGGTPTGIDLEVCLKPTYVAAIPTDPDTTFAVAPFTGYTVSKNGAGRITVCAPQAATETSLANPAQICVTR